MTANPSAKGRRISRSLWTGGLLTGTLPLMISPRLQPARRLQPRHHKPFGPLPAPFSALVPPRAHVRIVNCSKRRTVSKALQGDAHATPHPRRKLAPAPLASKTTPPANRSNVFKTGTPTHHRRVAASFTALSQRLLIDTLRRAGRRPLLTMPPSRPASSYRLPLDNPDYPLWMTPAPSKEKRDDILLRACPLRDIPQCALGDNMQDLQWGKIHTVTPETLSSPSRARLIHRAACQSE